MSDRHDMAARFAVLKVLADRVKDGKAVADCEIRDAWHPGDRNTAELPGGEVIGTVTLAKGRAASAITDETAFLEWVTKTHPDQVETVTRVRPDYATRVKSAARQLGHGVDPETGEEIPGLSVSTGDPYPVVKLAADAEVLVAEAWLSGSMLDLVASLLRPEIEPGGG